MARARQARALLPFILLGLGLPALPAHAEIGRWTAVSAPISVPWVAYDSRRARVLIAPFGLEGELNDLWVLDVGGGTPWRRTHVGGTPPYEGFVRSFFYDERSDRLVALSGPSSGMPNGGPLSVWALPLGTDGGWQELPATAAPADRIDFAWAYDPNRNVYLLYGGQYVSDLDAWTLSLGPASAQWKVVPIDGPKPTQHWYGRAGFDARGARMLIFGGDYALSSGGAIGGTNEVLALVFAPTPYWTTIEAPGPGPGYGRNVRTFVDTKANQFTLVSVPGDSAWALELGPSPRWLAMQTDAMPGVDVGDFLTPRVDDGSPLAWASWGQVLAFHWGESPAWSIVDDQRARAPHVRNHALVYDPVRRSWLVFGDTWYPNPGDGDPHDVWRFDPEANPQWTDLGVLPGDGPPATAQAAVVFDPVGMRWIVDLWDQREGFDLWALELWPDLRWQHLSTSGTPPSSAYGIASACDPLHNQVFFYGGRHFADSDGLWRLSLTTLRWDHLTRIGPAPRPRLGANLAYDPTHDRLILFGGARILRDGAGTVLAPLLGGTWTTSTRDSAGWDSLAVSDDLPGHRSAADLFFDPARNAVGLWGGYSIPGSVIPSTKNPVELALDGTGWSQSHNDAGSIYPSLGSQGTRPFDPASDRYLQAVGPSMDAFLLDRGQPTHVALLELEPNDTAHILRSDSNGLVTVAILSSPAFDASTVDPASVTLAGAPARPENGADRSSLRDVNHDRQLDRVLRFRRADMATDPSAEVIGLAGRTRAGEAVVGWALYRLDGADRGPLTDGVGPTGDPDAPSGTTPPIPTRLTLTISGPVHGPASVKLGMPREVQGATELEVFSVSGRRLVQREMGALAAGEHALTLGETTRLAPGIYFARLRADGETAQAKFVVLP